MLEIFQYDFMVRALIAGIVIAMISPLIGVFLVMRRYSLLADTLSHVSLVGVALALIIGINPVVGAIVAACLAGIGIEKLRDTRKIFGESLLALFLSGSLALAIVLLSVTNSLDGSVFSYLFGSITTVSRNDVLYIASLGIIVLLVIILFFKQLFITAYDQDLAKSSGVAVKVLNTLLIVLAAVTVSLSMRVVGSLLVGALMVIPVLTATQFGFSFKKTTFYAVIFSVVSIIIGLFSSFYVDIPSGGTIVIVTLVLFAVSLFLNQKKA